MSQTSCCLCVNICSDFRRLSNDIHDIVVKYFDSAILDAKDGVICSVCWRRIFDFHNFQLMIHYAQKNFSKYQPKVETDVKTSEVLAEDCHHGRDSSEMAENANNIMQLKNKNALPNGEDTASESSHYTGNCPRETFIKNYEFDIKKEYELMNVNSTNTNEPDETENYEKIFMNDTTDNGDYYLVDRNFHIYQSNILQTALESTNSPIRPSYSNNDNSKSNSLLKNQLLRTNEPFNSTVKRKSNKQLDALIARHKPNLECGKCNTLCLNFDALREHFKVEHPNDESYILCCDLQLNRRSAIEEHILLHLNPNAFRCEICGKFNKNRNGLYTHRNYRHPEMRSRTYSTNRKR